MHLSATALVCVLHVSVSVVVSRCLNTQEGPNPLYGMMRTHSTKHSLRNVSPPPLVPRLPCADDPAYGLPEANCATPQTFGCGDHASLVNGTCACEPGYDSPDPTNEDCEREWVVSCIATRSQGN